MRHADTATLSALSDQAVANDFNEWLTATFFDEVARPGRHILALAIPHGVRPESRKDEWPPHFRTLWYAEMADGRTERVRLDVRSDDLDRLPQIPGSRSENPFGEEDEFALPAVVLLEAASGGYMVVDGKHVQQAAAARGVESLPSLVLPDLSDAEVEAMRQAIPDAGEEYRQLRAEVVRRIARGPDSSEDG